jgi:hypothetical protein
MRFPYPIWSETGRKGIVDNEAERWRSLSSLVLRGAKLGHGKMKLDESGSCRESRWCSRSTGSWLGGDVGGCRRRPGVAAEVQCDAVVRKGNGSEIVGAGAEEGVHWELKTCFKSIERAQWARDSVGGQRRAWRPQMEFGQRRGGEGG